MTEDGIRTRRNFPAETWAVIRDAYLGGETAESISRRLNISINTIRKRASRCGWTHAAHARAIARAADAGPPAPVDLRQARDGAIAYAASLLGEGRALEASAVLRAAEALGRITGDGGDGPPAEPPPPTPEEVVAERAAQKEVMDVVHQQVMEWADQLAFDLLTDRGPPQAAYGAFAWRWRAWVLGPEVALSDFRAGIHGGWASRYWDAEGRLLEIDPIPPRPDLLMVTQHLRRCQGVDWGQEDLTGWRWPPRDWWGEEEEGEGVVEQVERGPRVRAV
ncbi:hypothetical protein BZG35_14825 [Brevundimonas sp. LM2]|uniref:hypothetical protein n=1 Tax=Brevundimonas sp. LM2 TaxID=1938605 RepID=UPI000983DB46|nr:hypothetical protein [Brevundimonas sp. LM2]AQR62784.1 hypothetical protein BZG35_14825 [Brevundimonas sp. LM2]